VRELPRKPSFGRREKLGKSSSVVKAWIASTNPAQRLSDIIDNFISNGRWNRD
jgi:hypothetical protein